MKATHSGRARLCTDPHRKGKLEIVPYILAGKLNALQIAADLFTIALIQLAGLKAKKQIKSPKGYQVKASSRTEAKA